MSLARVHNFRLRTLDNRTYDSARKKANKIMGSTVPELRLRRENGRVLVKIDLSL